jgi:hypothetical protein
VLRLNAAGAPAPPPNTQESDTMTNFLKGSKAIIAMVHVGALPGTPRYAG